MKKFPLIFTTALATALLSGCGSPQQSSWDDYPDNWDGTYVASRDTRICVDPKTNERRPDRECDKARSGGSNAFLWYYLGRNSSMPYYGERVRGGSFTRTAGATYFHAPSAVNQTRTQSVKTVQTAKAAQRSSVSRGGFGSSSSRFGGSYS